MLAGGAISGGSTIDNSVGGFAVDHALGGSLENVTVVGGSLSAGVNAGALRVGGVGGAALVLDGVDFTDGQIPLQNTHSRLTLRNGTTLANTRIHGLGVNATLVLEDSLTVGSGGNTIDFANLSTAARTILVGENASFVAEGASSLTLGSNTTIDGSGGGSTFVNRGGLNIAQGRTLTIGTGLASFVNEVDLFLTNQSLHASSVHTRNLGRLTVGPQGQLSSSDGFFFNEALIENHGGTINLGGSWSNGGRSCRQPGP